MTGAWFTGDYAVLMGVILIFWNRFGCTRNTYNMSDCQFRNQEMPRRESIQLVLERRNAYKSQVKWVLCSKVAIFC